MPASKLAGALTRAARPRRDRLEQELRRVVRRARGTPDLGRLQAQGLRVSRYAYVAPGVVIDPLFPWLVDIEDEAVIAPEAFILAHDATTRRVLGWTKLGRVRIGRNAFVGARSVILPGVRVGDGAIVAAGSVVRRDVAPGTVVAGNPAIYVMTTEEYLTAQRERMEGRPRYPSAGWTAQTGVDHERREQMRESLADGPGYVK